MKNYIIAIIVIILIVVGVLYWGNKPATEPTVEEVTPVTTEETAPAEVEGVSVEVPADEVPAEVPAE